MLLETVKALRSGGTVRYHAQPEIPSQTVAEHMWGVAMLVMMFYPTCSALLLKAAISHDCGEVGIGDIPSPTKRRMPELREAVKQMEDENMIDMGLDFEAHLSETERTALKICDVLEGLWYTAKHYHRTGEGFSTLRNWAELAQDLPLNIHQTVFVNSCLAPPMKNPTLQLGKSLHAAK